MDKAGRRVSETFINREKRWGQKRGAIPRLKPAWMSRENSSAGAGARGGLIREGRILIEGSTTRVTGRGRGVLKVKPAPRNILRLVNSAKMKKRPEKRAGI